MEEPRFQITTPPFAEVCQFTIGKCPENEYFLKDVKIGSIRKIRAISDLDDVDEFEVWCVRIDGDEYEFERVDCPHYQQIAN